MKRIFALLLAAVMVVCLVGCGKDDPTPSQTVPSTTGSADKIPTGKLPTEPGEGVLTKVSYNATGADILAAKDTVVAKIGDHELTLGQLQVYYWMHYREFLNEYSYYLSYFGLDYTKALDTQVCVELEEGSWQHFFLQSALNSWHNYQSLAILAEKHNTPMEEALQKEMEELEESLKQAAKDKEYDSPDELLQNEIGPGVTFDNYKAYQNIFYTGYSYYAQQMKALDYSMEQIETYYNEHEKELAESHITKESGDLVDVRHILISIEGGTKDDSGKTTYSDEDWENCRAKAQKLLDEWKAGEATEKSFADMAVEHSTDTGSASNGGLYEGLNEETNFVEEFKAWYLDKNRQVGDTGLVKSTYGYHIMFYSAKEAEWIRVCRNQLTNADIEKLMESAKDASPITIYYENVLLGNMDLTTGKEITGTTEKAES